MKLINACVTKALKKGLTDTYIFDRHTRSTSQWTIYYGVRDDYIYVDIVSEVDIMLIMVDKEVFINSVAVPTLSVIYNVFSTIYLIVIESDNEDVDEAINKIVNDIEVARLLGCIDDDY